MAEHLDGLSKEAARGIEQRLIDHHGLDSLRNKINSIASDNLKHEAAKEFADGLLKKVYDGYK